ncbi:MAG: DUF4384 domain-containing protein [Candidatus Cryptobacteroides sp.]
MEQAKRTAEERAKTEALSEAFGTSISQVNATNVKNTGESSEVSFVSSGVSEVKGEWLSDVKAPEFDITYEEGLLIVRAVVVGKVREVSSAALEIEARILRNGKDMRFESSDFRSGDDMYLLFKAPCDGYLAVYLTDSESAYCLLPYMNDTSGKYEVKGGQEYLFFSSEDAPAQEKPFVDEYVMTADSATEMNTVYVVFSPSRFTKANDSVTEESLPRSLSLAGFQKWLSANRLKDKSMAVQVRPLSIFAQ